MNKPPETIPKFDTEAQERACQKTHDSTEHLDRTTTQSVTLPNREPTTRTISLRLPQQMLDAITVAANARDVPYRSLNHEHLVVR